jgi:hypothetical protein
MTQPDKYQIEVGDETQETEVIQEVQEVESEEQETVAEPSPDSGETHEKPIFTEEQQRIFDEAIGKKVFKLREKEREAENLRKQLEELRKPETQSRPAIPEMPDPFSVSDDEYKRKIREREQALISAAAYDAQQRLVEQQQRAMAEEAARMQQEALVEKVQSYSERAKTLGVRPDELQAAGAVVGQFGIDDSLVQYILEDDHGPLITKYLSQNVQELDNLRYMHPTMAAVRIATHIKAKAAALKPRLTNVPNPIRTPQPSGIAPKPKGPRGATFE